MDHSQTRAIIFTNPSTNSTLISSSCLFLIPIFRKRRRLFIMFLVWNSGLSLARWNVCAEVQGSVASGGRLSEATGQSTASATPGAEGERKWTIFGRNGDGRSSRKKTDTPIYIYTWHIQCVYCIIIHVHIYWFMYLCLHEDMYKYIYIYTLYITYKTCI